MSKELPSPTEMDQRIDDMDEEMDYHLDRIFERKKDIEKKLGREIIDYITNHSFYHRIAGGVLGVCGGLLASQSGEDFTVVNLGVVLMGYVVGTCLGNSMGERTAYRKAAKKFPKLRKEIRELERIARGHYIGESLQ